MAVKNEHMDPETQRMHFGWFGAPWPSGVCYDDDGRVNEAMRIPVPVGQICFDCQEPFLETDQGKAMPYLHGDTAVITYVHKECLIAQVVGPLAHVERRCSCYGGNSHTTRGMTRRQEALAVWQHISHGRW